MSKSEQEIEIFNPLWLQTPPCDTVERTKLSKSLSCSLLARYYYQDQNSPYHGRRKSFSLHYTEMDFTLIFPANRILHSNGGKGINMLKCNHTNIL